jgi:hypothetical protein
MATIVTRDTGASAVSRPLTISELDNNFINLDAAISAISAITVPKITGIVVTDSSYAVLDDTAVTTSGGYIKITGTGFTSGSQVLIGTVAATSVSFVSSTELRAQVPATAAGTYVVYVVATDGSVAIRVNGITFSATPTWTTSSTLGTSGITINIQLAAVSDTTITYSLAAGSTLPTGLSLSNSGLLSGTVTEPTVDTTYNFTINAVDLENQDSPRTFSITITVKDPYFSYVSLLLNTGSTNGQQNNTFLDSSTNNFTIARNGTPTQGSITPYWPVGQWSNYLNGSSYFQLSPNTAFAPGTSDFTVECWIYVIAHNVAQGNWIYSQSASGHNYFVLNFGPTGVGFTATSGGAGTGIGNSTAINTNTWYHIAVTRLSGIVRVFVNGVSGTPTSNTTDLTNVSYTPTIGSYSHAVYGLWNGYISNFRYVKGTAVYTTAFTPPTTPLTAITNTSLLTCQSNRFCDNSTNNFALTVNGTPTVQAFQPFSPTASYTTALYGGSGYFNGSTDYLTLPASSVLTLTADFTIEFWVYSGAFASGASNPSLFNTSPASIFYESSGSNRGLCLFVGSAIITTATTVLPNNQWNHVVCVRSGSTVSMFVNGSRVGTNASFSSTADFSSAFINRYFGSAAGYLNGYMSNFRVVKGTAVYDPTLTTLTVPTAPVTAVTNTSLLLNMTNAGIYDAAVQNDFITVADAKTDTTIKQWPLSSVKFDGTGDLLYAPSNVALDLASGDFTIEFWFNTNTLTPTGPGDPGFAFIVGKTNWNGSTGAGWSIFQFNQAIRFLWAGVGLSTISTGNVITSTGTWYYVAVVRSGTATNNTKIYINGVQQAQGTPTITASSSPIAIGGISTAYGWDTSYNTNGYIQDLRITRGVARTITTPTLAFQTR